MKNAHAVVVKNIKNAAYNIKGNIGKSPNTYEPSACQ